MSAQCFTAGGAGEAVGARALAWLAIAAACDSVAVRREAALLAQSLADSAEAVAAAAGLAEEDPIRLAALGRDEVLGAIASRGLETGGAARTREARWLALRRAVDRRDLEAWNLAAMRGLDQDAFLALPLLASRRAMEQTEASVSSDTRALLVVGSDLRLNDLAPAPIAGGGERSHADVIALFETLLESMPESADGVFLDRQVLRGWYRAPFDASRTSTASRPVGETSPVRAFAAPVEVRARPARRLG